MNRPPIKARPVIFGEVLFDCFPDGSRVLGGAPFNVAWHCQAFGLRPLFISRVGNDPLGREVRSAMLDWGMDSSGLQLDSAHPTGVVQVRFDDGEPRYEIVENSAWDFIDHPTAQGIERQGILYHGSLALRNPVSAASLAELKQQCSDSIFVDINLRPPWWSKPMIEGMLQQGRWLKLNIDELKLVQPEPPEVEVAARQLMSRLGLELVVVTLGAEGALALSADERCSVRPERIDPVVDTVGAGDAFTSVLLLGLHRGWPLSMILERAQRFASAVVGQRGATNRERRFYQPFLDAWSL